MAFGEFHEIIFAWLSQIRAICYLGPSCLQHWPEVRTQSEDRNASARQVLFVLDALISRDKEIKTGILVCRRSLKSPNILLGDPAEQFKDLPNANSTFEVFDDCIWSDADSSNGRRSMEFSPGRVQ